MLGAKIESWATGKCDKVKVREEQKLIAKILRNRRIEKRRKAILRNSGKALEEYRKGLTSEGTVADLLKELEEDD